jgi:hypothetical protein
LDCINSVKDFVIANFNNAQIKDAHHYMLEYQIPMEGLLLSEVFRKLEILCKTDTIEDYSVSQTTLDQIFVSFARSQVEAVHVLDGENSLEEENSDTAPPHTTLPDGVPTVELAGGSNRTDPCGGRRRSS